MWKRLLYEGERKYIRYRVKCSLCKQVSEADTYKDFTWGGRDLLGFTCPHCKKYCRVHIRDVKEVPYIAGGYQPVNEG